MRGAYTLAEIPDSVVYVTCDSCPRRGRYRLENLIAKYGAAMRGPDFLAVISADCTFHPPFSTVRVCGVRFTKGIDSRGSDHAQR